MSACVVVIRLNKGDDLLGILISEQNNKIKVEHPFYARFHPVSGQMMTSPYCPLSDETFFEFKISDVEFVVLANTEISYKFLAMVSKYEQMRSSMASNLEDPEDQLEATILNKTFISGNTTKH